MNKKVILFANTAWYLYNFRLSLAKKLKENGYEVVLISPPDEYAKHFEELGFRWISLPMDRRSLNLIREFFLIWHVKNIYQIEKPALVHHFTLKSILIGSIAAKLARIPKHINAIAGLGYIFSSQDLKARILKPVLKYFLRFLLKDKNSTFILQNSNDLIAFDNKASFISHRIKIIKGSGVNIDLFKPPLNTKIINTETKVLLAARLLWDKGIREFVNVAYDIKKMNLPIQFLVAGMPDFGNPNAVPMTMVEKWKNEGVIDILGQYDDMPTLLANVDIFVLPTNYGEGLPRSLLEAGACGLPLITTNIPGCSEVVEEGVNGILIAPKDVTALKEALIYLHENIDLRIQMGVASRKKICEEFDEDIIIKKTIQVYSEILLN